MCRDIHFHGIQLPIKIIGHWSLCKGTKGFEELTPILYRILYLSLQLSVDWYDFPLLMWQRDNRHASSWHLARTCRNTDNILLLTQSYAIFIYMKLSFLYNFAFYKGYGVLSAVVDYIRSRQRVFEYPYQGRVRMLHERDVITFEQWHTLLAIVFSGSRHRVLFSVHL